MQAEPGVASRRDPPVVLAGVIDDCDCAQCGEQRRADGCND
jgi:hypothetical protein